MDVKELSNSGSKIIKLDLRDLAAEIRPWIGARWSQLVEAAGNDLSFIEYLDKLDPTKFRFIQLDWETGETQSVEEFMHANRSTVNHPYIYEHGSDYFRTVMDFLSIDSPLSCEYLEWGDKIIISYYLRSVTKFERYLLLLKDGKKVWKVKQDEEMNGFSSGSFFVFQDQLIFIKDLNEVCIYTD